MLNVNGVGIEYQFDGAHDARPAEHTLHGLDGLNLSGLDWMRLSHVCRLMAARDRKPERTFVRVSGWTADRPNMRLIVDVLQDDDGTVSVPLPLTSDYLLVFAVLGVVWRAGRRLALRATHRIPRDAQPLLEDTKFVMCLALVGGFGLLLTLNPGLLVLPKDTTFTEQVARQAGLEALSCPTILDSKYMPGQGRYECEYVDAKGKAHDMSLLVASGDKVWLYDHNGKPMKVEKK